MSAYPVIELIFSSFWTFIGALTIIATVLGLAFAAWNRFLRMLNIRKNGWPPPHCDADGDFPIPEDKE